MTSAAPVPFEHRFAVQERIGAGGMGVVYRAVDRTTGRHVAVKVMRSDDAGLSERFAREASALEQLVHPAIVGFVAAGWTSSAAPYLAMEWVDGETLSARLARGPLSVGDTIDLAIRLAEGLDAAHGRGIVHRDLKPANIVLHGGEPSRARILDFGIARLLLDAGNRLTVTGEMIGTPAFMAPEQARGDRALDHRVDLYSLGCVVFRSLTGRNVFDGDEVMAVVLKALLDPAPRLADLVAGVPPELEVLVASLLAKAPDDRPASAGVVADALRAIADGVPPGDLRTRHLGTPSAEVGATSTQPTRREPSPAWSTAGAAAPPATIAGGTPAPGPPPTIAGTMTPDTTDSRRTVWIIGAIAGAFVLVATTLAAVALGSLPVGAITAPCPVERCEPLDLPDPSRADISAILASARAAALRMSPRADLQVVMVHGAGLDGRVDLFGAGATALVSFLDDGGRVLMVSTQRDRLYLTRQDVAHLPVVPASACDAPRAIAAAAAVRPFVGKLIVRLDALDPTRRGVWAIMDVQHSNAEVDAQTCAVLRRTGGPPAMAPTASGRPAGPGAATPGPPRQPSSDPFARPH